MNQEFEKEYKKICGFYCGDYKTLSYELFSLFYDHKQKLDNITKTLEEKIKEIPEFKQTIDPLTWKENVSHNILYRVKKETYQEILSFIKEDK